MKNYIITAFKGAVYQVVGKISNDSSKIYGRFRVLVCRNGMVAEDGNRWFNHGSFPFKYITNWIEVSDYKDHENQ